MEDFDIVECQIQSETKQASLDVIDMSQPLSRTPSVRSNHNENEGRYSPLEGRASTL